MRPRWNFAVLPFLLLTIVAQFGSRLLAQPAPDAQKIGVYASSEGKMIRLSVFGAETTGGLLPSHCMKLEASEDIPRFSSVIAFFMNLPGAAAVDTRLVWMPRLDKYVAARPAAKPGDFGYISPELLKSLGVVIWRDLGGNDVERVSGDLYKYTATELAGIHNGMVALLVKMPLGSPDRIYPIQIGSGAQPVPPPSPSPGTTTGTPGGVQGSVSGGIRDSLVGRVLQPKYPGVPAYDVEHVHGGLSENCRGTLYLFPDKVKYEVDGAAGDGFESPFSELQDLKVIRGPLGGFSMRLNSGRNFRFRVDRDVAQEIVGKITEVRKR